MLNRRAPAPRPNTPLPASSQPLRPSPIILFSFLRAFVSSWSLRFAAREAVTEAQGLRVRKHVFDMSGGDAPLDRVPVVGVEQVGVVFEKYLANPRVAQQECSELLGEHVVGADRVPGLCGD